MRLGALFRLGFPAPPPGYGLSLPHRITRWLIMQKARRHTSEEVLRPLVSVWFQELFHSPCGDLFTFQSPYWLTIGHLGVFSLGGWTPRLQAEFHELDPTQWATPLNTTGLAPSTVGHSMPFTGLWVCPGSLAATSGIAVAFFSSGYLDVSLHQVRSHTVCIRV